MKKTVASILALLLSLAVLTSCSEQSGQTGSQSSSQNGTDNVSSTGSISSDPDETFGSDLVESGFYDGYFETEAVDVVVECISGTENAYTLDGNVLTFTSVAEDSVYRISGQLNGSIIIDTGDDYKFELELYGFSLVSTTTNPIMVVSGDKVILTAKKDSENYIYDQREAIDEIDDALKKGAIHSDVDLRIGGKGSLIVVSENNNGIHTKDDLEVQNLTLSVTCCDNALKGNDSVELTDCTVTLIAKQGDGIKTSNSDISSKGNQKGDISISGANVTIYAACDGIDASYNAIIDGESAVLNIYTDKYSSYSEEVTATSTSDYYIRFTSSSYKYSIKYYNSDSDYEWVNATYYSTVSSGRSSYYYYTFPRKSEYAQMQFFIYGSGTEQGQDSDYLVASDYMALNTAYDTLALTSRGNSLTYSWTNYTTSIQQGGFGGMGGMGGMNDGNSDKSDYSTKGIKAANEIWVLNGTVTIKAYDDAIHANNDGALENGETPTGNIIISGGTLSLYSNDDGIHADGSVEINGGKIDVVNSYEGIEGNTIVVSNGDISVIAKDDGMNSTATSGTGITLKGGYIYIYCSGDGMDANSRTSYAGISFEGGDAVIISNSSGNSAIDTEQGYKYTAGNIIAIMPRGGMTSEATHCSNFSSVGTSKTMSFTSGKTVTVSGDLELSFTMPCSISNAMVVILNKNNSVS